MLSSRLALGVGTLSLVAVTSISTAVLVNDSTQRLAEPPLALPQPSAPTFKAPPLVVPVQPGTVVATPSDRRRVAPSVRPARRVVVTPPQAGSAPDSTPDAAPAVTPPFVEPPLVEAPVFFPPLVVEPVLPGKGKHLGKLRARDTERGKGSARSSERPRPRKG